MSEGGGKKKPLDIIDHMTEHLSSYEGRYLVIPGGTGPYPSYYPYIHQPFLYPQQIHPHLYTHRGYGGGGESGGCLIENMVGNWSPDLSGTYSPFGGAVPPQPPLDQDDMVSSTQPSGSLLPPPHQPQHCLPTQLPSSPHHQPKKQRIVAQVKPLRPSYSDVVSKSTVPPPLSPASKTAPQLPAVNKSAVQPPSQTKDQSRHKAGKQASAPAPASNYAQHTGNKESSKKETGTGSDDILDGRKSKKGGAAGQEWSEGVKTQQEPGGVQLNKQNANRHSNSNNNNNNSANNKKNKQSAKQTVREEKTKCSGVGGGKWQPKSQTWNYSGIGEVYRKYVAVSDDEENDDDREELDGCDDEADREPTPPTKQHHRFHHAETTAPPPTQQQQQSSARKHSGVKVERTVNSGRSSAKSKRSQRASKRKENKFSLLWREWREKSSHYLLMLASWLINLLVDVAAMSAALLLQLGGVVLRTLVEDVRGLAVWLRGLWSKNESHPPLHPPQSSGPAPLHQNIQLPTTGEEAMKRLLSCKGKDPYSILGLTSNCTDEDIRRYYRSQALLVHPDKNSQPGAEEAFKILVHAFDLIAEPDKRAAYDRYVSETNQVEQAWSELSDLLSQLHEKMHYAATTIRCNNCGKRHKRTLTERPVYAARYCAQCNIHHSAKEGDMWCEVGGWLFWRRYLACMEGSIYEITDWARCQGGGLTDLVPHSHSVHYRVLLGGVDTNTHQQTGEAEFEDLLSSIYGQSNSQPRSRMNNRRKAKKTK